MFYKQTRADDQNQGECHLRDDQRLADAHPCRRISASIYGTV